MVTHADSHTHTTQTHTAHRCTQCAHMHAHTHTHTHTHTHIHTHTKSCMHADKATKMCVCMRDCMCVCLRRRELCTFVSVCVQTCVRESCVCLLVCVCVCPSLFFCPVFTCHISIKPVRTEQRTAPLPPPPAGWLSLMSRAKGEFSRLSIHPIQPELLFLNLYWWLPSNTCSSPHFSSSRTLPL